MSDVAIRVEGLSKRYRIGAQQQAYKTLRDKLNSTATAPFRALRSLATRNGHNRNGNRGLSNPQSNLIWALKDVSFEVKPGEVVGIIGRNGAGKSTLLKILSRITEPTKGFADINGRIASLLEVGTGFHPELTGRENIFLNGSILGMKRAEIQRKFDEIVAFAEIEKFIDTAVKFYSSGMYVRLAFAVAAHLDPEILLIDEVLAVGDAAFQKKCLGKMGEVAKEGRTVLFVSHNMAAVENLCDRGLLINKGKVIRIGEVKDVIAAYMDPGIATHEGDVDLSSHPTRRAGALSLLRRVRLLDKEGNAKDRFSCGEPMKIEFTVDPLVRLNNPEFGIGVHDWMGSTVFSVATYFSESELPPLDQPCRVICQLDEIPLAPGRYTLSLSAGTSNQPLIDAIDSALSVDVEPVDFFGNGRIPHPSHGRVLVRSRWESQQQE
jgi:lipopolysaccharide transport system ATP-binding protein